MQTAPTVRYRIKLGNGEEKEIRSPSELPDPSAILEYLEPITRVNVVVPAEYIGAVMKIRRGRQVFAEGEPAAHWYWLTSGAVQVCSFAEDGRRQVAELVLPGDLFGLEACARRGATGNC